MTAAYQPNSVQSSAYQAGGGIAIPAYQNPPFQGSAFQARILADIPAFQEDTFQYDPLAFQMAIPVPPTPIYDGHDGGKRKKLFKKIQELETARMHYARDQAEHRKMLIRHAIDPEAKKAYEAKIAAEKQKLAETESKAKKVVAPKEIEKQIDRERAKLEKLAQNLELKSIITAELGRIHEARLANEREINRQIRQADDELALMMMM